MGLSKMVIWQRGEICILDSTVQYVLEIREWKINQDLELEIGLHQDLG